MQSLREVLKAMKRQKRPLACPVCGGPVRRMRNSLNGWILPEQYYCIYCRYSGFLVMEREQENETEAAEVTP